jgi:hypothetical protein
VFHVSILFSPLHHQLLMLLLIKGKEKGAAKKL